MVLPGGHGPFRGLNAPLCADSEYRTRFRVSNRCRRQVQKDQVQVQVQVQGIGAMWFLRFAEPADERRFLLGCAERGVLIKRGAYNFPSLAHGAAEVGITMQVVGDVLETLPR